jgi:hypothetical protein
MNIKNKNIFVPILLSALGVFVIMIISIITYITITIAGNEEIYRVSANSKYDSVLFERDAGATTKLSYQISIIRRGNILPNKQGNIFICEYNEIFDKSFLVMNWKNDNELNIEYRNEGIRVYRKLERWNAVVITYSSK